jgi:capsular polysaccharide biosynthesis protein
MSQATSPAWRVTLITPARRPVARKTKDYVRMALAPIFSVVIGLGLVFFIESLDHSIKSPAEAEELTGLPVLATLWEMKKKIP